eukprot:PhF_6_TR28334/c0_g1_i1/m.41987
MLRMLSRPTLRVGSGVPVLYAHLNRFQSTGGRPATPVLDLTNINDDPSQGFCVRVVYQNRCLEVSHYPQLGPRKVDPNDPSPQFDFQKRIFMRFNKGQMAELLAVIDNKIPNAVISTNYGGQAAFDRQGTGYNLMIDSPEKDGSHRKCNIVFEKQYAASFKYFTEFSLAKSFGFYDTIKVQKVKNFNNNNNSNNNNNGSNNTNTYKQPQQQQQQYQQPTNPKKAPRAVPDDDW